MTDRSRNDARPTTLRTTRRDAVKLSVAGALGAAGAMSLASGAAAQDEASAHEPGAGTRAVRRKRIPKTGELIPIIGLGTSRTFDVATDAEVDALVPVMEAFLNAGGMLIDSSPMYGHSEAVVGKLLDRVGRHDIFFATKVWTNRGKEAGIEQMNASMRKMGAGGRIDLMQVHNLVDWQTHLPTLREWKEVGRVRYIGITEMRDWETTEKIMREEDIDFIQVPYSIAERAVEDRILPAARDLGIAVLVMRPFQRGRLFRETRGKPLPEWAAEFDIHSWAQFFLKFIVSHPAVTCPIPATSDSGHMIDDMKGGVGRLPDQAARERMLALLES